MTTAPEMAPATPKRDPRTQLGRTAPVRARLTAVETLAGFDFSFQLSFDRNRTLTLAQLEFIERGLLHVLGPPATGQFGKRSLEELGSFGDNLDETWTASS